MLATSSVKECRQSQICSRKRATSIVARFMCASWPVNVSYSMHILFSAIYIALGDSILDMTVGCPLRYTSKQSHDPGLIKNHPNREGQPLGVDEVYEYVCAEPPDASEYLHDMVPLFTTYRQITLLKPARRRCFVRHYSTRPRNILRHTLSTRVLGGRLHRSNDVVVPTPMPRSFCTTLVSCPL